MKEIAKVPRHGPEIMRHENALLLRGQREHLGIRKAFQLRLIRGEKIHGRFSAQAAGNDRLVKIRVRQKADHPSGSPRQQLLARPLQLSLEVGRGRMGFDKFVLLALPFRDIVLHFLAMP